MAVKMQLGLNCGWNHECMALPRLNSFKKKKQSIILPLLINYARATNNIWSWISSPYAKYLQELLEASKVGMEITTIW